MEKYQEGNNYYSILVIKILQAGPSARSYFFQWQGIGPARTWRSAATASSEAQRAKVGGPKGFFGKNPLAKRSEWWGFWQEPHPRLAALRASNLGPSGLGSCLPKSVYQNPPMYGEGQPAPYPLARRSGERSPAGSGVCLLYTSDAADE